MILEICFAGDKYLVFVIVVFDDCFDRLLYIAVFFTIILLSLVFGRIIIPQITENYILK